jgi:hypothetical protein
MAVTLGEELWRTIQGGTHGSSRREPAGHS